MNRNQNARTPSSLATNLLAKCTAEAFATFCLTFFGCGAAIVVFYNTGSAVAGHVTVSLAFGLVIMAMVFATGHLSGAHINPAVTVAFAVSRHFPVKNVIPYIMAQLLGAIAACAVLTPIVGHLRAAVSSPELQEISFYGQTVPTDITLLTALGLEFVLTAVLMFVIMAVATDHRVLGNMAGLAIGGTIAFEALAFGPLTGASMNPARSLAPALFSNDWTAFSAYIIGPFAGGIAGSLLYNLIRCDESEERKSAEGCCET